MIHEYDHKFVEQKDLKLLDEANNKMCEIAKDITQKTLNKLVLETSIKMKNGYNRADN